MQDLSQFPPPSEPPVEARKVERPSPLSGLANAWLAIVAVAIFVGQEFLFGDTDLSEIHIDSTRDTLIATAVIIGPILLILIGSLLLGIIQWRTTTFIVDHEFRIEQRFIGTKTARIDFTKVQSVDIIRPLVARLLGLAEIKIDVGGEGGQNLRFLKLDRAESMRDHLLARMEHESPAPVVDPEALPDGAPPAPAAPVPDQVVYKADPGRILLGAFLSVGVSGVVLVVIMAILFGPLGLAAGLSGLWVAMFAALIRAPKQLITNWGFTITRSAKGLRIQQGLLTQQQTTLRPGRVQTITLTQNLFHRWAGLVRVQISVLGNSIAEDAKNDGIDLLTPYGKFDEVRHVISLVWPEVDPTTLPWQPQHPKGRWLTWFGRRWYAADGRVVASRRTLLSDTVTLVPHARVQGLGLAAGPLQRALGLGTVAVHTIDAGPNLAINHLAVDEARGFFEWELAQSSRARREGAEATR